jgi:hypothetical protein
VRQAHDAGSKQLQAKFRSRLHILAQLRRPDWGEPHFKRLTGDGDGLSELRFKADGVQQRPLGFESAPLEYTILFWATERGGKFVPRNACAAALVWKAAALGNRTLTDALWIPYE